MSTINSWDGTISVTLPGPTLRQRLHAWFDRIDIADMKQRPLRAIAMSMAWIIADAGLSAWLAPSALAAGFAVLAALMGFATVVFALEVQA